MGVAALAVYVALTLTGVTGAAAAAAVGLFDLLAATPPVLLLAPAVEVPRGR